MFHDIGRTFYVSALEILLLTYTVVWLWS